MDTLLKRNAYSYIRFSTPEQAKGDSFRRQLARTTEFCNKHNLLLNQTRYADLGVSGWTGKNIDRGALGDFIYALKAGKIEKGSVLVVENFDRFSRLKPRIAYNKLAEIIELGVDVVTLEDGKFHTKETLDDFATLVYSLATMQRANEESSRKSELVGSAWAQKRRMAAEGKSMLTSHCPLWLRPKADGSGFEVIPERVKILKRIFKLIKEGKGKREIARMLDAEKVARWSKGGHWRENYILDVVKSRTLLGELQPRRKKQAVGEPVKGYYPAIIDEATWLSIQPTPKKAIPGPRSAANCLFPGLLFDGYHPEHCLLYISRDKTHKSSYLQSDYQRVDPEYRKRRELIRKGKKPGPRPLSGQMFCYEDFERHFLKHFEKIDFLEILPDRPQAESSRFGQLEAEKKENSKALANLIKALEGGQESALVMAQIEKREAAAKRLEKDLAIEAQKTKAERHAVDSFEDEQERLEELAGASTREARLALRALFNRIIKRIDLFMVGLIDVTDDLKEYVYPDRNGMTCYRVTMVGSYKMWIWWDGCQVWEESDATDIKPAA